MYTTMRVAVCFFVAIQSSWSADRPTRIALTPEMVEVAKGYNQFATKLYASLSAEELTNLIFSPFSIAHAMAIVYAGADGQTKAEMSEVFNFPQDDSEFHLEINALRKLMAPNDKKSDFQLRIVSRLWGQRDNHFFPKYVKTIKANYGIEPGSLNFRQPDVAAFSINSWIDKQTDHKIRNLVDPGVFDELTRLVLTDVIYFKARWLAEFKKSLTSDDPFYVNESLQVTVPTMNQSASFNFLELSDAQILEMPYLMGDISMLILLPKSKDGLKGLEQQLSDDNLRKWSADLKSRKVNLHLPKFKIEAEFDLIEVLKSMGMSLAYAAEADFSRMAKAKPLYLSSVVHKATVDVNEEGTEAAAATSIVGSGSMNVPEKPIEFRADHPFVFLIRHNSSQSILFLGRVQNPKGKD